MTDAVKMAIEALEWIVEREKSASSAAALEMARAATDALDKIAALEQAGEPVAVSDGLTLDEAWQDLVDKDDRTSPEEYPDMALITREELADYMQSPQSRGQALVREGEAGVAHAITPFPSGGATSFDPS